jgi:hypothetical protein
LEKWIDSIDSKMKKTSKIGWKLDKLINALISNKIG